MRTIKNYGHLTILEREEISRGLTVGEQIASIIN